MTRSISHQFAKCSSTPKPISIPELKNIWGTDILEIIDPEKIEDILELL